MDADWLLTQPIALAPGLLKRGTTSGCSEPTEAVPFKYGSLREETDLHTEQSASLSVRPQRAVCVNSVLLAFDVLLAFRR
jgi:hypothetical protein